MMKAEPSSIRSPSCLGAGGLLHLAHVQRNRGGAASRRERIDGGRLRDIAGQTKNLIEEIDTADLVVMVSAAGSDSQAALLIGEACAVRKVTTIGLIVQKPTTTDEETSRTLKHLRAVATMLVIANGEEYIEEC